MDMYRVEKSWDGSHRVRRTSGDEELCAAVGTAAGWVIGTGIEGLAGLARHVKNRRLSRAVEDMRQAADSDENHRFLRLATDFVRRYPSISLGHAAYADALARTAQYEPALRAISHAVELGFDETEARMIRADIYDDAGQPGKAIQEFTVLATSAGPELRQISLLMRARLLKDVGDYTRALADANEALAVLPDGWAYTLRGHVYRAMGDLDRCVEDYSRAILLDPDEPGYLENRAEVYGELGRSEDACTDRAAAAQVRSRAELAGTRAPVKATRPLAGSSEGDGRKASLPLLTIVGACVLLVIGIGASAGAVIVLAVVALLAGLVWSAAVNDGLTLIL